MLNSQVTHLDVQVDGSVEKVAFYQAAKPGQMVAEILTQGQAVEVPLTKRTLAIMEKLEQIEAGIEKLQEVTDSVRQIQKTLEIRESRWNAFVRSLKHFLSLIGEKLS